MGGNESTGLGSADHHNSRDMREFKADDRPTDETNVELYYTIIKHLGTPKQPLNIG